MSKKVFMFITLLLLLISIVLKFQQYSNSTPDVVSNSMRKIFRLSDSHRSLVSDGWSIRVCGDHVYEGTNSYI